MTTSLATSLVVLSCLLLFSSAATAFNITKILSQYPDYGAFNNLLTQTHVAKEINTKSSITVLAVKDSDMSAITSKPIETQTMIMKIHVMLDYYDQEKLSRVKGSLSDVTTLFQSTGIASYGQGFLNITNKKSQGIFFGSTAKGAPQNAHLNKYVFAMPFNVSILEVSSIIIPPGLDGAPVGPALPPSPAAPVAPAPAPSKKKQAPAPSPAEAEVPVADAPVADESPAPDTPASSPSPSSSSPSPSEADKPADDDQQAAPPKSSAGKAFISSLVLLVSFVVTL